MSVPRLRYVLKRTWGRCCISQRMPMKGVGMGSVEMRQGVTGLRDEAFRLAESLSREANAVGMTPEALDAATTLQSVAFMLGQVESYLVASRTEEVKGRLVA